MTSPTPPNPVTPADIIKADRDFVWHPFTQMRDWLAEDPLVIERAEGNTLIDIHGRRYFDGVSSLWVTVHGHRHPDIDAAVRAQLDRVAHTTLLGLASVPSIQLAERLVAIAPPGLTKVFYSDSGSTAVEIALKIAFQTTGACAGVPKTALRGTGRRLSRRHHRLGFRRRDRALSRDLPPAPLRCPPRTDAVLVSLRSGAHADRLPCPLPRRPRPPPGRARSRDRGPRDRTTRSRRRRHARPTARLPRRRGRSLPPPRCPPHLRRGLPLALAAPERCSRAPRKA